MNFKNYPSNKQIALKIVCLIIAQTLVANADEHGPTKKAPSPVAKTKKEYCEKYSGSLECKPSEVDSKLKEAVSIKDKAAEKALKDTDLDN